VTVAAVNCTWESLAKRPIGLPVVFSSLTLRKASSGERLLLMSFYFKLAPEDTPSVAPITTPSLQYLSATDNILSRIHVG